MNKAQLVDELSTRFEGNRRQASNALEAVIDTITRAVAKGEKVAITGFGVFEKIDRPARLARNPLTGEKVRVKKTSVPRFKPGAGFKDVVSGARKLPKLAETARDSARKTAESARESARKTAESARGAATKAAERLPGRAPAKKAPAKAAPAKAAAAKSAPAKKSAATAAKKAPAKKTTATAAKKTTAKKAAPAKKATTAKKTTAKKTTAKKTAAKR